MQISDRTKHQKIAVLLFIGLCSLAGIILGYIVYALGTQDGLQFSYWLTYVPFNGFTPRSAPWAIGGAIVGAAIAYIWNALKDTK